MIAVVVLNEFFDCTPNDDWLIFYFFWLAIIESFFFSFLFLGDNDGDHYGLATRLLMFFVCLFVVVDESLNKHFQWKSCLFVCRKNKKLNNWKKFGTNKKFKKFNWSGATSYGSSSSIIIIIIDEKIFLENLFCFFFQKISHFRDCFVLYCVTKFTKLVTTGKKKERNC